MIQTLTKDKRKGVATGGELLTGHRKRYHFYKAREKSERLKKSLYIWDNIKRNMYGQLHRRTSKWLENLSNLEKSYLYKYMCGDNIIKCRYEDVNVLVEFMMNTNTHVRAL